MKYEILSQMEGQSSVVETSCNDSVNGVLDVPGRLNTISWAYIQSILNKFCPGGTTSRLQSQFNSNHQSVKARTFCLSIQTIIKARTLQRTKHPGPV